MQYINVNMYVDPRLLVRDVCVCIFVGDESGRGGVCARMHTRQ